MLGPANIGQPALPGEDVQETGVRRDHSLAASHGNFTTDILCENYKAGSLGADAHLQRKNHSDIDHVRFGEMVYFSERSSTSRSNLSGDQRPFHALDRPCLSSSWLSKDSGFRQETRQSYYRNDPVKYNLTHPTQ